MTKHRRAKFRDYLLLWLAFTLIVGGLLFFFGKPFSTVPVRVAILAIFSGALALLICLKFYFVVNRKL